MEIGLVPFTRYTLPNGRMSSENFETDKVHADKAAYIIDHGYRFEVEILTTGFVSATIYDTDMELDVAITLVRNGPPLVDAINEMIDSFYDGLKS